MRNHNEEYRDNASRKYAYDFDAIIRRYLLRTLKRHFVAGDALELGCYKGDMTEQILAYFPSITVVEAASDLADIVRRRFGPKVTVISDDVATAHIDRQYANIFLVHTLEHLDDPVIALRRIREWLTPAGRLFVAVPNANALSRQLAVKMGLIEFNAAVTPAEAAQGHRRTYSMDVLSSDLRDAGLRIDDCGGVLVKPLANYQFDAAIAQGIITDAYLDACQALADVYPELCATIYAVCSRPTD